MAEGGLESLEARFAYELGKIVTEINMTEKPGLKLQGLAAKIDLLKHGLDDKANRLDARVNRIEEKAAAADTKAHKALDRFDGHLTDLEKVVTDFDGANG